MINLGSKLTSDSRWEHSWPLLMDCVHSYDKLKRVLQLCNVSDFMSEYGCSVITERLKEALTSGKHFHEQNVKDVTDRLLKERGCGLTSLGSYYLHMDLHTGTCSWLSIMKGERSKWFHILASTYSASKSTWKSSGLHGWCETCSIKMANSIVCVFIQVGRQLSLKECCFTSPTHSDNYPPHQHHSKPCQSCSATTSHTFKTCSSRRFHTIWASCCKYLKSLLMFSYALELWRYTKPPQGTANMVAHSVNCRIHLRNMCIRLNKKTCPWQI